MSRFSKIAKRYDFGRQGSLFLVLLMIVSSLVGAAYVVAHRYYPAALTVKDPTELVRMDTWGRTFILSADDVDWNVGAEKALPLLTLLEKASQRIDTEVRQVQSDLDALDQRFGWCCKGGIRSIRSAAEGGHFREARDRLACLREALSPSTLTGDRMVLLARLEGGLSTLAGLKREQELTRANLRTPARYVVFWMTPVLVLVEVVFWSLFGLLTSLLLNVSQYRSENQFRPAERWVIYTKLIYTPVVALVFVLALWAGLISIGGPESRVWVLPLISFLIGFNVRKAVTLVDALSQWVLDRATNSLRRTDAEREAARKARLAPYAAAMPAAFLSDLRAEAKAKARELLLTEIQTRELKL